MLSDRLGSVPAPLDCSQMSIDRRYLCLNPLPLHGFRFSESFQHGSKASPLHIPMMNVIIRHFDASSAKPGHCAERFPDFAPCRRVWMGRHVG